MSTPRDFLTGISTLFLSLTLSGQQKDTEPPPFQFVTLIIIGSVVWVVLMFLVILFIIYRKRHNTAFSRTLSLHEVKEVHSNRTVQVNDNFENLGITNPKYESVVSLVATLGLTVFSKENLVFDRNLGEGAFGKVWIFLEIHLYHSKWQCTGKRNCSVFSFRIEDSYMSFILFMNKSDQSTFSNVGRFLSQVLR